MKQNHWPARLIGLMILSYAALIISVTAAGTAGTETDPLVTVSYLNETFLTQLLGKVDEKLSVRDRELADKLNAQVQQDAKVLSEKYGTGVPTNGGSGKSDSFTVVDIANGKTLYGEIGCEVMLRVGTAKCIAPSAPGLIDETDGTVLASGGALVKNHLYMMTIDERGVTATAASTKVLVRGGYTIR